MILKKQRLKMERYLGEEFFCHENVKTRLSLDPQHTHTKLGVTVHRCLNSAWEGKTGRSPEFSGQLVKGHQCALAKNPV